MEDLASRFNQNLENQGKEWTKQYLESIEKTVKENFSAKDQAINEMNLDIFSAQQRLRVLHERLDTLETNQRTAKQKEFLQESMIVLGALIATIGTGLLIWAFVSALYSFGWQSIWQWQAATPDKNAHAVQQALAIGLKSLLSIAFFLLGTAIMFAPLGIYHAFLKSIQYKYRGIRGRLNKIFLKG